MTAKITQLQQPASGRTVSLVVPLFNEVETVEELTRRIGAVIEKSPLYQWEVLYINDGSSDGTAGKLSELAQQYPWLSVIHFSRNFGHQIAISAGIDLAVGDAVILMDGDLQDPPELLPEMLILWEQGFDVVYATRKDREGESIFKKATAAFFYRFLQRLADISIPLDTGDFRLMSRTVVNALAQMREKNRFIRGMVSWVGYRQTPIYYQRDPRFQGQTKFTLLKMLRFAMDGLLSFSKIPLQWITTLGFAISVVSFAGIFMVIYLKLFTRVPVEPGWSSLMLGVLVIGGIQLICLGMIGEYIGRIFDEVRARPLYLIGKVEGQRAGSMTETAQLLVRSQ